LSSSESLRVASQARSGERGPAVPLLDERGTYVGVGLAARGNMRQKSWKRAEQAAGRR
jgi:hypothetical protein